ncbi:MAG: MMPL family transporter [Paludibacteraceae bacterium]|nr:MMPL family transporter [Paludibacteraceae bacterium]
MNTFFLRIYDYLGKRKWLLWLFSGIIVLWGVWSVCRIKLDEDIAAFLPLDGKEKHQMELYGQFSGSEKIVVVFEGKRESLMDAIDSFQLQYENIGLTPVLNSRIDVYDYVEALDTLYNYMPYFLTAEDYENIGRKLDDVGYPDSVMKADRQKLLMPLPVYEELRMRCDPLNLFDPVVTRLMRQMSYGGQITLNDGYMMSRDGEMAIVWLETPYGASETDKNAGLVDTLEMICGRVKAMGIDARLTGAPVIAVGNARCIKHDSMLAGIVAMLIIVALLWIVLRQVKSMLLILLTVGFGWLVAMSVVSCVFVTVSMIVIGMGSVLVGIAVNYPLHVVMHHNYTDNVRSNLDELVVPLVIGNITTVGAFCALLPLKAEAIRQLGLFAAALLIGTILFSVVILPHILPCERRESRHLLAIMPTLGLRGSKIVMAIIVGLTIVFAFFIPSTSFDNNLSNINYMTDEQRNDLARLSSIAGQEHTLYMIQEEGQWDDKCEKAERVQAMVKGLEKESLLRNVRMATDFMPSKKTQKERIVLWNEFIEKHKRKIDVDLNLGERKYGFADDAFAPFEAMLNNPIGEIDLNTFEKQLSKFMPEKVKNGMICETCQISPKNEESVIKKLGDDCTAFTMEGNNMAMAETLSDEFDYIGLICSLIVFVFLCISFKEIKLAILAFIPMVVSWIWILGIMGIVGIQFNLVNIILATFIFGQGDDYTIFMVEGVVYEHKTGSAILPQYRTEIVMSALIMLVGIGTLVISRHPAMHSLGTVTLIGMTVVVLTAYIIPQAICKLVFSR